MTDFNTPVSVGEWKFTSVPSSDNAAATLYREVPYNNDRSGAFNITVKRIGGVPGNGFFFNYAVETASTGMDVGMTSIISHTEGGVKPGGGILFSTWVLGIGPIKDEPHIVVGTEINTVERAKDYGLQKDRSLAPSFTVGLQIIPENQKFLGGDGLLGFNQTYGLAFTQSSLPAEKENYLNRVRTHIPIYIDKDATVPGGIEILMWGGSLPVMAPEKGIELRDHFRCGIDMTSATFTDFCQSAIMIGANQSIRLNGINASGNIRFNQLRGHVTVGEKHGSIYDTYHSFGVVNSPGVYYAWNGTNGNPNSYWLDLSGTNDSIAAINGGIRLKDVPVDKNNPKNWLKIYVDGVASFIPLFR